MPKWPTQLISRLKQRQQYLHCLHPPSCLQNARLVIAPLAEYQRSESVSLESLQAAVKSQDHGNGTVSLHLPWPLDDQELRTLLEPHKCVQHAKQLVS